MKYSSVFRRKRLDFAAQERKNQQGIKRNWVRSKISYWQASKITQILKEERYTGTMGFGNYQRIEVGKREVKRVPENERIVIPNVFPAIITTAQFERVRKIMSAKAIDKHTENTNPLLFERKIKCGNCGHALRPSRYNKQVHYYCATRYDIKLQDCLTGYVCESDIKIAVLAALRQQIMLSEQVKTIRKSKSSMQTVTGLNGEIQSLRRLIDKSKTAKMTLWEEYHSGSASKEVFQRESDKLTEQVLAYESKIAELESERKKLELQTGEIDTFVERHIQFAGITELTREVLDIFVKEVRVYTADRIEIAMNFADEYKRLSEQLGVGI